MRRVFSCDMSKSSRTGKPGKTGKAQVRKKGSAGPIAFFVSLFIIALGTIQLVSTFHTYALNLAELNGLKREEASLIAQKQELENDIKRWDDKAYITAQARERLGFVFPGEQAVRVLHPEAVTGSDSESQKTEDSSSSNKKVLPWYSELSYSLKKADEPVTDSVSGNLDRFLCYLFKCPHKIFQHRFCQPHCNMNTLIRDFLANFLMQCFSHFLPSKKQP